MAKVSDAHTAVTTTDHLNALHGLVTARLREARFEGRHSLLKQRRTDDCHRLGQADFRPDNAASLAK
jgi:hypothetical protein